MARIGSLHVTVITATLLRDPAGSDSGLIDTYASVGCGNQSFTTNSVKNHKAKPSWNESYTFRFEERFRNDLESQHILIEIFAEKPKLDELLGLANDCWSDPSTSRQFRRIIYRKQLLDAGRGAAGQMSRKSKLLGGDIAMASIVRLPAYPQAYNPAARYNPNASTATDTTRANTSTDRLQANKSCREQQHEDNQAAGEDRGAHQRSSSCPSRSFSLHSAAPAHWPQRQEVDQNSHAGDHPSSGQAPGTRPLSSSASCHSSSEARPNTLPQQGPDHRSNSYLHFAGPHIPYVSYEGSKACAGITGIGPTRAVVNDSATPKHQDEESRLTFSRAKQAEMAKLAELSRLTESAKLQATGFARAGHQPAVRTKQSIVQVRPQPQHDIGATPKPKCGDAVPLQQPPSLNNASSYRKGSELPLPRLPSQQQVPIFQETTGTESLSRRQNSQRFELYNKQLAVVPTMLDIVQAQQQTARAQRDDRQAYTKQLYITSPRKADVFYEKAIQKADRKPEQKTGSTFRRTWKILRKTTKIFGI